jgi:hypothetical protein
LGRGDAPRPSNATPHQPDEAATARVGSRRAKHGDALAWLGDVILKARNTAGRTQTAAKEHKTDRRTQGSHHSESWKVSELGLEWVRQGIEGACKIKHWV